MVPRTDEWAWNAYNVWALSELRRDKSTYHGEFREGQVHGKGLMTFSDHPAFKIYDGDWENGAFHGWGVLELNSGERYQGQWNQGKRSGLGYHRYGRNGILSFYKGEWKDDEFHGIGYLS
jgi:hypothetical protein